MAAVDPRTLAAYLRVLGAAGTISSFELTPDGGVKATFSAAPRAAAAANPDEAGAEAEDPSGWDLVLGGKPIEARWVPPETTTTEDDVAVEPSEEG